MLGRIVSWSLWREHSPADTLLGSWHQLWELGENIFLLI